MQITPTDDERHYLTDAFYAGGGGIWVASGRYRYQTGRKPLRQRIKNDTFCVFFMNDAMIDAKGGSNDTVKFRAGRRNPNVPASHHPAI